MQGGGRVTLSRNRRGFRVEGLGQAGNFGIRPKNPKSSNLSNPKSTKNSKKGLGFRVLGCNTYNIQILKAEPLKGNRNEDLAFKSTDSLQKEPKDHERALCCSPSASQSLPSSGSGPKI